jgi:hypothetical protein
MRRAMRLHLLCAAVLSACATVRPVAPSSCRFEAALDGITDVDLVGQRDAPGPDAEGDLRVRVRPCSSGVLRDVALRNEGGTYSLWHSTPDAGAWLLGVVDPAAPSQLRNTPETSPGIAVEAGRVILLYGADNGSVRARNTRYSVTLTYDDGHIEHGLVRQPSALVVAGEE